MLNHVKGRCKYKEPLKRIVANRVSTNIYRAWLGARNKDFLKFLNLPEDIQILKNSEKVPNMSFEGSVAREMYKDNFS